MAGANDPRLAPVVGAPVDPRLGAPPPSQASSMSAVSTSVTVDRSVVPEAGSFGALLDQAGINIGSIV